SCQSDIRDAVPTLPAPRLGRCRECHPHRSTTYVGAACHRLRRHCSWHFSTRAASSVGKICMHFSPSNTWDCTQFSFNESVERVPKKLANPVVRELDSARLRYVFPTKEKPLFPELFELGTGVGNRHFRRGGSK